MASNVKWYDDAAPPVLLAGALTLTQTPGSPGPAVTVNAINDKDGSAADDFVGRVRFYFSPQGGGDLDAAGDAWADGHYVEARLEAGGWNTSHSQGDWIKVGAGVPFSLPVLSADEGARISVRINAPLGADEATRDVEWRLEESPSQATSVGLSESTGDGIHAGVRDRATTLQVTGGNAVQDPAGPNRNVQVQTAVYVSKGTPYAELQKLVNVPVASSGNERFDLISLAAAGTGHQRTAGSEVTAPATDSDKPAVPAGDLAICYVRVNDGAVEANVLDAHIENVWALSLYALRVVSGRTVELSRGPKALAGNALTRSEGVQQVTLEPSVTSYLWLKRTGTLQAVATSAASPADGAVLLWEADTNATDVTATRDRRHLVGGSPLEVRFEMPEEITSGQVRYAHVPGTRAALLLPLRPVVLSLGSAPAGSAITFDVEVEGPPSTWTSIFATKPTIADGAADPVTDAAAVPTLWSLAAGARLRATATLSAPGSVTSLPEHATLTLRGFA